MTSQDHNDDKPAEPSQEPAAPAEPPPAPASDSEPATVPLEYHTAADDGPQANTALPTEQGQQREADEGKKK